MTIRLGINGFGRIGRLALRIALDRPEDFKVVAVNTSGRIDTPGWAHLFKYDTAYGKYDRNIETDENGFIIDGERFPVLGERDLAKLPWTEHQVDVLLECTGIYRTFETASKHIDAGAKKVVISAPAKGDGVPSFLVGINHTDYNGETVMDCGSCTTNCAAPILKVVLDNFGIERGFLNTIHAYTGDQRIHDGSHSDLRRARAGAENIVLTTTGASRGVVRGIPELEGKLQGVATRVPVLVGSLVDFTLLLENNATPEEINQAFTQAANSSLKGILEASTEPLVSSDIVGNPHSSIADLEQTKVIGGNMAKIISWYDNEWGYACRMMDLVKHISHG
jgi:glyceraldehyde 3-phosphate dehydrogenase